MHYDRITRLLHMFLVFGITLQLVASTLMVTPRSGAPGNAWWVIHEYLGAALGVVLILHWGWTLARGVKRGEAYLLFPWFSKAKLTLLFDDIKDTLGSIRRGRLPEVRDTPRALPAAVQSLGLILATFLSASGVCILLVINGVVPRGEWIFTVREAHETLGGLMWLYLIVHPLIAIVHEFAGDRLMRGMFTLRTNEADR